VPSLPACLSLPCADAHIFDLLTRLRQAVDHPYLVTHSARAEQEQATGLSAAHLGGKAGQVVGDSVCGLCHELADDPVLSSCKHAFCRACAAEFVGTLAEGAQAQCPTCWRPLTIDLDAQAEADGGISFGAAAAVGGGGGSGLGSSISGRSRRGILSRLNLAKFQSSTKIEALMEELSMMESRDPVGKAIVFSQVRARRVRVRRARAERLALTCPASHCALVPAPSAVPVRVHAGPHRVATAARRRARRQAGRLDVGDGAQRCDRRLHEGPVG
jgi:hypothetical protein